MSKQSKGKPENARENSKEKEDLPGYPHYPENEDIYNKDKKEEDIDLDTQTVIKGQRKKDQAPGDDLDVPGSELDDQDEEIGEEDEENNYYSLGGDNHEDLEEDKGE